MLSYDKPSCANLFLNKLSTIFQTITTDKGGFSGYLKFEFDNLKNTVEQKSWYLFFSRGKIVFSGDRVIEFSDVFNALKNYIPGLRSSHLISSGVIEQLISRAKVESDTLMVALLGELALSNKSFDDRQFNDAIELYIVEQTEQHLSYNIKSIEIIGDGNIDNLRPIVGLGIALFLSKIKMRIAFWENLKTRIAIWENVITVIPSLDYYIACNVNSSSWKKLSIAEKKKIERLVSHGDTLEEVRYKLGEDSLKVAQIFSKLIKQDLVTISVEKKELTKIDRTAINLEEQFSAPRIAIVDDSPVLLKQFSLVVQALGYQVKCCVNALEAVGVLAEYQPLVIFIDINMPELSGFQLIKQIRSQAELNAVPLVILTAEKTIMNQQRAKWSKSQFLSKPLSTEDGRRFVTELKATLQSLAPIAK